MKADGPTVIAVVAAISLALLSTAEATSVGRSAAPKVRRHAPMHRTTTMSNPTSRPSGPVPIGVGSPTASGGPNPPCCKR